MANPNTGRGSQVKNENPIYHKSSLAKPKGSERAWKYVDVVYTGQRLGAQGWKKVEVSGEGSKDICADYMN